MSATGTSRIERQLLQNPIHILAVYIIESPILNPNCINMLLALLHNGNSHIVFEKKHINFNLKVDLACARNGMFLIGGQPAGGVQK